MQTAERDAQRRRLSERPPFAYVLDVTNAQGEVYRKVKVARRRSLEKCIAEMEKSGTVFQEIKVVRTMTEFEHHALLPPDRKSFGRSLAKKVADVAFVPAAAPVENLGNLAEIPVAAPIAVPTDRPSLTTAWEFIVRVNGKSRLVAILARTAVDAELLATEMEGVQAVLFRRRLSYEEYREVISA